MDKLSLPQVYPVTAHTDFVGLGSTFVAISGKKLNGLSFVPLALKKGATKIVVQDGEEVSEQVYQLIEQFEAKLLIVSDARKSLAELSAKALGYPSSKLKVIGVTGTKGKTSTSYMIYHMLMELGKKVALSSTIEKKIGNKLIDIPLTTPLPDQLQMFFDLCVQQGVEYVVLEVSAQSLSLNRVAGIKLDAGLFTNFSLEHLEFYDTIQDYFDAKARIVDHVKNINNMIVNIDDKYGSFLQEMYPDCTTISLEDKRATLCANHFLTESGLQLQVKIKSEIYTYRAPLIGRFNAYNLLGAVAVLRALNIDLKDAVNSMMSLQKIPGRMEEYVLQNGSRCFIDYAHNPSSFEAVLSTLRVMTSDLIVVFGAGGCRDKQKRPMMGEVAQRYANKVILTSDNPRDEDPADIIADIARGLCDKDTCQVYTEVNRIRAIEMAYHLSGSRSIIAVLGKGPDEYQIVGDLTFPFKERSIIKKFMQEQ